MQTPADKPPYARWATAAGAALLLGVAAIVPLAAPGVDQAEASSPEAFPGAAPVPDLPPAFEAPAAPMRPAKCRECGVIESTREIVTPRDRGAAGAVGDHPGAQEKKRYETIVRLQDGSRRAVHDVNPASWRTGERVILIAGSQ